jgi:hypothetical protein
MLGKLFGSNARVRILKRFLSNPNERFYIRQLSRDLKLQLNSVRRELENLEKFGLLAADAEELKEGKENNGQADKDNKNPIEDFLLSTARKKEEQARTNSIPPRLDKKYYRVNKDFVLYEEIRALIVKAQVLYERDFIEKINQAGNIKLLALTGYFVSDADASVDMLIVGRIRRDILAKHIAELEVELGREINYTVMENKEFKYRRDITDVFLFEILERKKLLVINDLEVD